MFAPQSTTDTDKSKAIPAAMAGQGHVIQRKLEIGAVNDPLEHEADAVADKVMRMTEIPFVQRKCAACEDEDKKSLQKKELPGNGSGSPQSEAPPIVHEVLSSHGQPLDTQTRTFMESRFGHDFSGVRVHTDAKAEESARAVNAHAFTVGNDLVFNDLQYSPGTITGKQLLAHELTHVIQQQSSVNTALGIHKFGLSSIGLIQLAPALQPSSEDVWGLRITRSMCGCRQGVQDAISWANTAAATYAACDVPANATGADVQACFFAAHPTAMVVATTSSSGTMTLPPPSANPCEIIENKGTFVHETMHSRHANAIASAQGTAFFREWRRLAGDPNRLDTLRVTFPAQVAAFETQWKDGHDWAQDEINSYKWERRFFVDTLAALNRVCS